MTNRIISSSLPYSSRYPYDEAATVALSTIRESVNDLKEVCMHIFSSWHGVNVGFIIGSTFSMSLIRRAMICSCGKQHFSQFESYRESYQTSLLRS